MPCADARRDSGAGAEDLAGASSPTQGAYDAHGTAGSGHRACILRRGRRHCGDASGAPPGQATATGETAAALPPSVTVHAAQAPLSASHSAVDVPPLPSVSVPAASHAPVLNAAAHPSPKRGHLSDSAKSDHCILADNLLLFHSLHAAMAHATETAAQRCIERNTAAPSPNRSVASAARSTAQEQRLRLQSVPASVLTARLFAARMSQEPLMKAAQSQGEQAADEQPENPFALLAGTSRVQGVHALATGRRAAPWSIGGLVQSATRSLSQAAATIRLGWSYLGDETPFLQLQQRKA